MIEIQGLNIVSPLKARHEHSSNKADDLIGQCEIAGVIFYVDCMRMKPGPDHLIGADKFIEQTIAELIAELDADGGFDTVHLIGETIDGVTVDGDYTIIIYPTPKEE